VVSFCRLPLAGIAIGDGGPCYIWVPIVRKLFASTTSSRRKTLDDDEYAGLARDSPCKLVVAGTRTNIAPHYAQIDGVETY